MMKHMASAAGRDRGAWLPRGRPPTVSVFPPAPSGFRSQCFTNWPISR